MSDLVDLPEGKFVLKPGAVMGSGKIIFPINLEFEPQRDLTAYELALILPYLFRSKLVFKMEDLGELRRHFKEPDDDASAQEPPA